jgi:ADP-glucose pyrophosphorylase
MNGPSVLALVLAGGEGSRLGPLTDEREAGFSLCRLTG